MTALAAAPEPQLTVDEKVVEDPELEAALDKREDARAAKAEATGAFKVADTVVKAMLDGLELEAGKPVRVAGYLIERRTVAGRDVNFSTEPTSRLWITRDA